MSYYDDQRERFLHAAIISFCIAFLLILFTCATPAHGQDWSGTLGAQYVDDTQFGFRPGVEAVGTLEWKGRRGALHLGAAGGGVSKEGSTSGGSWSATILAGRQFGNTTAYVGVASSGYRAEFANGESWVKRYAAPAVSVRHVFRGRLVGHASYSPPSGDLDAESLSVGSIYIINKRWQYGAGAHATRADFPGRDTLVGISLRIERRF